MKKLLLTCLIIVSALSRSQSQNVLNPGFENWTSGDPDYWLTNNFVGAICVTQSSDAHSGSSSARAEIIDFSGTPYTPVLSSDSTYGFPVSQAFTTLEFWYKLNSVSNDAIEMFAFVYDAAHSVIAYSGGFIGTPTNTYAHAAFPIAYTGTGPANCLIYFTCVDTSAGSTGTHIGTYFLVDDVQLTNNLVGVKESMVDAFSLKTFPNPAVSKTILSYSLKTPSSVNISLFDFAGRKMFTRTHDRMSAGKQEETIDLNDVAAGKYICLLRTDSGIASTIIEVVR